MPPIGWRAMDGFFHVPLRDAASTLSGLASTPLHGCGAMDGFFHVPLRDAASSLSGKRPWMAFSTCSQRTSSSSTRKWSVASGGMGPPGVPRLP